MTPEELEKFETLVLPEVEVLSDRQAGMIRDWVKRGGTLVATYKSGLLDEKRQARSNFALADVLGVDYVSEERHYAYDAEGKLRRGDFTSTYLESAGHPLAKVLEVSTGGTARVVFEVEENNGGRGNEVSAAVYVAGLGAQ